MNSDDSHRRDFKTLSDLNPVAENPDFPVATACVRIELSADGPLSSFPGMLDDILGRAYDLIEPTTTFYGAEQLHGLGFPPSRGRKPRTSDRASFANITALMAQVQAADKADSTERFEALLAMGQNPDAAAFVDPLDGGNAIITDAFPLHQSGSHILVSGPQPWRVSLSFSLPIWQKKHAEIMSIAEDLAATAVFDSGAFGFGLNPGDTLQEVAERVFLPMTRRFRMLSVNDVRSMRLTRFGGRTGAEYDARLVYPISSWFYISRACMARHKIAKADIDGLNGRVHEVVEHAHSYLIKLWPLPILGDVNWQADMAPARALARALEPGMRGEGWGGLAGITVGYDADRIAWYRRFLAGEL